MRIKGRYNIEKYLGGAWHERKREIEQIFGGGGVNPSGKFGKSGGFGR